MQCNATNHSHHFVYCRSRTTTTAASTLRHNPRQKPKLPSKSSKSTTDCTFPIITQRPLTTAMQSQLVQGLQTPKILRYTSASSELATRDRRLTSLRLIQKLRSNSDPNQATTPSDRTASNQFYSTCHLYWAQQPTLRAYSFDRSQGKNTKSYHAKSFAKSKILMSF